MAKLPEVITVQSESIAISKDMRNLYEDFKAGAIKREDADTLANISGKNLKALSLMLADQMRLDGLRVVSAPKEQPSDK